MNRYACSRRILGCRQVFAVIVLLVPIALIGAALPVGQTPHVAAEPQAPTTRANPPATPNEAPLEQPLRLVTEARETYKHVRDYTCTLISQERVKGKLLPEHVVDLKFRVQPFSIAMRWLGPKDLVGREVYYVHGKNNSQMRVRESSGVAKVLGFISIDPKNPRVFEHSNHTILESGIGHLIGQLTHWLEQERQVNKTDVRVEEYEYNKRRCIRVELLRRERNPAFYCYRTVVYFDKEHRLPVRVENYDWPRQGGPADGELRESFSFINIQFNRGLTDAMFTER